METLADNRVCCTLVNNTNVGIKVRCNVIIAVAEGVKSEEIWPFNQDDKTQLDNDTKFGDADPLSHVTLDHVENRSNC